MPIMNNHDESVLSGFSSVRIWLCGPLHIEWVDPATDHASPLSEEDLRGKDTTQVLSLLKVLLCQPGRQAHRDWLMEQFWPEHAQSVAIHRFHNVTAAFRKLLSPPDGVPLLPSVSGRKDSTSIYTLAAYPRLWVDSDAIAWNIEQAARMERFGDDALPFWQRAFALLKRGPFLPDEPYAAWAHARRTELEGSYRSCVHALSHLYLARYGDAGKAEALLLLQTYWQKHLTDEDALRPLMELLGEQGRFQEAEACYQQCCLALTELGQASDGQPPKPDPRTYDLREYLRTKQIQRTRALARPTEEDTVAAPYPSLALIRQSGNLAPFSSVVAQNIIEIKQELFAPSESGIFIPGRMLTQMALGDSAVWFGGLIAQIIIMVNQWNKDVLSCADLQKLLDQEILMSMKPEPANEAYTLSRRQALITLATLPLSLLMSTPKRPTHAFPLEDFLPQCAASLTACWHLLQGNQLAVVEEVLPAYLPTLVQYAQHPSPYQKVAASLSSQSYLLRGLLAHHQVQFMARQFYCQEAIRLSILADDYNLQVAGLMHLGNTFYYSNEAEKALHTFREALPLIEKVSPLLRSCIHMRLAMASARCRQSLDDIQSHMSYAHQEFPEHPEHDPSFLYAEYGLANLHLIEGLAYLDLGEYHGDDQYYQRAWSTFSHIKVLQPTSTVSERNRIQIINYQAKTAAILGDQERFCAYLKMGIDGARALGSQKRRQEAIDIYWQGRKFWPNDTQVKALADLFVQ